MRRTFKLGGAAMKGPRVIARAVLGVLLAMNVVAAVFILKPWGGSPEDLAREQARLRAQVGELQARLARSKALAAKVEKARAEGDSFLSSYTTDRRTTFSAIAGELAATAKDAGIRQRECTIQLEPVEGSETLSQMSITCGYEATYQNLTKFINLLDHSKRFLIIEQLTASPQQQGNVLMANLKLDTFVRGAGVGQ